MRIHHFNCGTADIGLVTHCLLIETGDGLVLIDTGFGLRCVRDPRRMVGPSRFLVRLALREEETAVRRIEGLGLDPADVRHIVLTHLDSDHTGGLVDFPNASVHVHGPELRAARAPKLAERTRYRPLHWAHGPRWEVNEVGADKDWFGFPAVRELSGLPPEFVVIPLYGHSRGHVGVAVDTGSGWVLHAGDSFLTRADIDPARPELPRVNRIYPYFGADLTAQRENRERLRELVRRHGDEVEIFSSHDAGAFARLSGTVAGSGE
ncbi:MBL fold metallo-hydrolase [Nocardia mexicana]|uniref:Glyoxylase-like metal-dependent hydrolase (Beta-lactamase superfamily II) n=1 Tax=Nocardia mexicana TaxID=279262 RepID=A0A370GHD9_9NOCA|nr:MBL fold metallo-hydrolase [Nocardia mexicana]RDI42770.1 glyoxylase-like metal-dependent hydrolase (beta-lactamase superfamily II) [Nocardia mexicana]